MRFHLLQLLLPFLGISGSAAAQEFVEIAAEAVNVRVSPSGEVVGQAGQGDVFTYQGREGDWVQISMFSGEYRYVHASLTRPRHSLPQLPSESARRTAFHDLVRAERKATAEADRRIPPTTAAAIDQNIDLQRLLDDRYKLEVCRRLPIQPAHYNDLKLEGVRKGWLRD